MEAGPVFEDASGALLLTEVLTMPSIIKERHDTLSFENHMYIRHDVRLVVGIDRLPQLPGFEARGAAPYPAWGASVLRAERGRVVVPLGDLDRHSRATTHITDEAGKLVPLFTSAELNALLGSGLVAFAAMVLRNLDRKLIAYLRQIPEEAGANLQSLQEDPQRAADQAFEKVCEEILDGFKEDGLKLLQNLQFRSALATITSSVQLVVEVDPDTEQTRVFSYSFYRPILSRPSDRSHLKRLFSLQRFRRLGSAVLEIELGPVGRCERYQLNASAPFDTWFASARIVRPDTVRQDDGDDESRGTKEGHTAAAQTAVGGQSASSAKIDTGQRFRISYSRSSSDSPWSGTLRVRLKTVYTGVVRASVYGSIFLAFCAIAGTVRVIFAHCNQLIGADTDAAASLLLLFPGVAASAVAGAARNTLTATMQFPIRLTLWAMSCISFVLAAAAAFRLGHWENILLWSLATGVMCLTALGLVWRSKAWAIK